MSVTLSVTVLNYNYAHFLPKCLDSILSQSFRDFEVILINDNSTDDSRAVIQRYLADSRIRFVDHTQNSGFVKSLIEGSGLSRGRYISVISADDWVASPQAFERQIAVLDANPGVVFAYGAYGHYDSDELPRGHLWRAANESYVKDGLDLFRELAVAPYILHSGTMIRKTTYDAIGGYDASLKYAVDTKMWLALCHAGKAAYIDDELYAYRRHGKSMSKSRESIQKTIREVLSVIDWAFSRLPLDQRAEWKGLHKKAVRRALIAYAADEVFRENYREGVRGFQAAALLHPVDTVFQKTTVVLLLRTLLGKGAFDGLRNVVRSVLPG